MWEAPKDSVAVAYGLGNHQEGDEALKECGKGKWY